VAPTTGAFNFSLLALKHNGMKAATQTHRP
jgi:hypothetical protein